MYVLFMTRRRWPGTEWSRVCVTRHEPVDRGSVESQSQNLGRCLRVRGLSGSQRHSSVEAFPAHYYLQEHIYTKVAWPHKLTRVNWPLNSKTTEEVNSFRFLFATMGFIGYLTNPSFSPAARSRLVLTRRDQLEQILKSGDFTLSLNRIVSHDTESHVNTPNKTRSFKQSSSIELFSSDRVGINRIPVIVR